MSIRFRFEGFVLALALGSLLVAGPAVARGDDSDSDRRRHCSETATAQFYSCKYEVEDDFHKARAICINVADEEERETCPSEAFQARREGFVDCREQLDAREALCRSLGQGRYDPNFDPALFDDDFTSLTHPNPWFPLGIGHHWEYAGGDETVTIEVLDETKFIEGVICIVVNDRVEVEGKLVEDTDDWFAQRRNGGVDYCGESVKDFEHFEGDDPEEPELVSIDGSFKAGRDGDQAGTQFLGAPRVGAVYRQEFSPGNAEDAAEVLSTSYGFGSDPELDAHVPQDLAELLCAADDCVVTGEFSPLEPRSFARKYYAKGIGLFLEVSLRSGNIVQLVDCNFDPRCGDLPEP